MAWARRAHSVFVRRLLYALPIASLIVLFFFEPPRQYVVSSSSSMFRRPAQVVISGTDFITSSEMQQYWRVVRDELRLLTPQDIEPIFMIDKDKATVEDQLVDLAKDPDPERLDLINLSPKQSNTLRDSHERMIRLLPLVAPDLPYQKGSRGIVTTAKGHYFGMVVVSLRMLRRTGSKLPVLVFLDSHEDYDEVVCEEVFPRMGAECVVLTDLLDTIPPSMPLAHYQYKIMAMFLAPFQELLFMDADAFPAHNPDRLFDVEPYSSTGLVLWPDFWTSTASPLLYHIVGLPTPPLTSHKTSEAGILLYDKGRHAGDLLLTLYYNFLGPKWYYPLISQGAAGEGDKDTFMLAAQVVGAPFYDVKAPVTVMGRWLNETWHSVGMKQVDPHQEWKLNRDRKPEQLRSVDIEAKNAVNASSSETKGEEDGSVKARPFFIHQNIVKLDIERLVDPESSLYDKDEDGNYQRLWGPQASMVKDFGYDVEAVLWEELIDAGCQLLAVRQCRRIAHLASQIALGT